VILVIGGAGYIGSHMVDTLLEKNYPVITLDNLSTGHRDAVRGGEFILGDCGDVELLNSLFSQHKISAVMHFAAYSLVGESAKTPFKYYDNNVSKTLRLLQCMHEHHVRHFIFSSTAAIFGEPEYSPIDAKHPKNPINPYGRSKWMVEQILQDFDTAHGLKSISLRYFNAAGADPVKGLSERHQPETHLIPLVLQAAAGQRNHIDIFGDDYDTPDGTGIRDYIHVSDLCDAHLLALEYLRKTNTSTAFNLGNGTGFSVREVIETVKKVTGKDFKIIVGERRAGDPARLVAESSGAKKILGWKPKYSELEKIISDAWEVMQ
jgi:UDP-glucose 4-epimerase